MSKRTIRITIDCNAKTCGECEFEMDDFGGASGWCDVFAVACDAHRRCPECLRAEKEAKR